MNRLPSSRFEASQSSPVIVATDGREQSDGALRAGALFGGSTDAWRVVSASPLITDLAPELDLGITAEAIDVLERDSKTAVTCLVSGDFPGSPAKLRYVFSLSETTIMRLEII